MYKLKAFLLGIFVSFTSSISVYAQGSSPYSIRGIGDLGTMELPHNIGMGGIGLSQPQNLYLNNLNPALLPNNTLTHFGLGIMTDYKRIASQNASTTNVGGGLSYLTFAFPIVAGKWTLSTGLLPYSTVNYDYQVNGSLVSGTDTKVNYDYSGEGGITRAYVANGFQLLKHEESGVTVRQLSAGVQVNYLFGSIINETGTELLGEDIPSAYRTVAYDRTRFSDFSLKGGLSFNQKVRGRTFFNIGAIYELGSEVNAEKLVRLERQAFNNAGWQAITMDTIVNNVKGSVRLPSSMGFGVSLFKSFHWSVGSDITFQNWSTFRNFNETNNDMVNSYRIALGGEYTPEISSIDSYLKRMTYRMGVNYENSPIYINNEQVRDFGINFGTSLPVSRFSSLDLAFRFGRRGTLNNELIREDYFRVFLGITYNDKWFQRRKFD